MDPARACAIAAYAVLLGSLATPLYDPLSAGRDDSWALALLLGATHLGAGLLVRRAWVLATAGGARGCSACSPAVVAPE